MNHVKNGPTVEMLVFTFCTSWLVNLRKLQTCAAKSQSHEHCSGETRARSLIGANYTFTLVLNYASLTLQECFPVCKTLSRLRNLSRFTRAMEPRWFEFSPTQPPSSLPLKFTKRYQTLILLPLSNEINNFLQIALVFDGYIRP